MGSPCGDCCPPPVGSDPRFRNALLVALAINVAMFGVEIVAGVIAESAALLADAGDFLGDAANYGLSLFVLSLATVWRSRAAFIKVLTMASYGLAVVCLTVYGLMRGTSPDPVSMGVVGLLALAANASVAIMLYRYRSGDANMRSVWICSRNDAIGNVGVIFAGVAVFATGTHWPDLAVAAAMAFLSITGGVSVMRQAARELDRQLAI